MTVEGSRLMLKANTVAGKPSSGEAKLRGSQLMGTGDAYSAGTSRP